MNYILIRRCLDRSLLIWGPWRHVAKQLLSVNKEIIFEEFAQVLNILLPVLAT
jgi:hypothetical protein